jgi:hypothetical protein
LTAKISAEGIERRSEKSSLAGNILTWPEKFRHGQKKGVVVPAGMINQALLT